MTVDTELTILKAGNFEAWLLLKPPNYTAKPCNGSECPLADYLSEKLNIDDIRITTKYYSYQQESPSQFVTHLLPIWAHRFVVEIDKHKVKTINRDKIIQVLRSCLYDFELGKQVEQQ